MANRFSANSGLVLYVGDYQEAHHGVGVARAPERYPHIAQAAKSFKPLVARFVAAKKEVEQVFENLRGADMDEAVAYCREHPLGPEAVAVLIHVAHRAQTLEKAKAAAATRLANDPKRAAMREAYKHWQAWRAGHAVHRSATAFARHVVDKYPIIQNAVTVERSVRKWSREAKNQRQPVSRLKVRIP